MPKNYGSYMEAIITEGSINSGITFGRTQVLAIQFTSNQAQMAWPYLVEKSALFNAMLFYILPTWTVGVNDAND